MRSRFRIEIYDDIKANDLTLYSEKIMDREKLNNIVLSNLHRFQGNVRAYVFDNVSKAKVMLLNIPFELVNKINSKSII